MNNICNIGMKCSRNTRYSVNEKSCVIPNGFTISGKEGEYDIDTGLVIYNIPDGITIDWTDLAQTENARKI